MQLINDNMKKIIQFIVLAFVLLPGVARAQEAAGSINDMWSFPVVYAYDEEVTWFFDLSTTTFAAESDVYLWIWSPSEPDAGNWENSSEFAKLTYEGDMIWSFTLTPTEYFNMTPEDIAASAGFWFRLKDLTGSLQSEVHSMAYTDYSSFAGSGELWRSYPSSPLIDEGISILFNANLADGFEDATSVHFHSGLNFWDIAIEYQSWIPEVVEKTQLKNMGGGIYKMDLIPQEYYEAPDGYVMENIAFLFVKDDWAGTTADQVLYAGEFIPPPPPVFTFFPQQISKKDFLGIIRTNNEPGINTLIYTVTAGTVEVTGEITGGISEIKGFVNLVSALQNVDVTEIHVLVKDNTDKTISDTTIPLKHLD